MHYSDILFNQIWHEKTANDTYRYWVSFYESLKCFIYIIYIIYTKTGSCFSSVYLFDTTLYGYDYYHYYVFQRTM